MLYDTAHLPASLPHFAKETDAPRLLWRDRLHNGAAYNAALFAMQSHTGAYIPAHRHDFFEMFFVVSGVGSHYLFRRETIRETPLRAGSLLFLRPDDCHGFIGTPGKRFQWINVAFSLLAWETFRAAADLPACDWDGAPEPPEPEPLRGERYAECAILFEAALTRFHAPVVGRDKRVPDRAALCRFLLDATPFFGESGAEAEPFGDGPPWLQKACRAFRADEACLRDGLPRLLALAGVSHQHFARALKAATGESPTQFINGLRVARAALLLTTTTRPLIEIARQCGFNEVTYFYRLFRKRFDCSPDVYRKTARTPYAV